MRELQIKLVTALNRARNNLEVVNQKIALSFTTTERLTGKVYLLSEPKKGKFAAEYPGPHVVLEIYKNNNVKISYKRSHRIVHSNKLKHVKAKTPASASR